MRSSAATTPYMRHEYFQDKIKNGRHKHMQIFRSSQIKYVTRTFCHESQFPMEFQSEIYWHKDSNLGGFPSLANLGSFADRGCCDHIEFSDAILVSDFDCEISTTDEESCVEFVDAHLEHLEALVQCALLWRHLVPVLV